MSADQPFLDTGDGFTRIGNGDLGGKANGLVFFKDMLVAEYDPGQFPQIEVGVPTFAVICTDFFDAFMQANDLYELAMSDSSDEEMARAFQRASLPRELVRNLEGLTSHREKTQWDPGNRPPTPCGRRNGLVGDDHQSRASLHLCQQP